MGFDPRIADVLGRIARDNRNTVTHHVNFGVIVNERLGSAETPKALVRFYREKTLIKKNAALHIDTARALARLSVEDQTLILAASPHWNDLLRWYKGETRPVVLPSADVKYVATMPSDVAEAYEGHGYMPRQVIKALARADIREPKVWEAIQVILSYFPPEELSHDISCAQAEGSACKCSCNCGMHGTQR